MAQAADFVTPFVANTLFEVTVFELLRGVRQCRHRPDNPLRSDEADNAAKQPRGANHAQDLQVQRVEGFLLIGFKGRYELRRSRDCESVVTRTAVNNCPG